MSDLQPINEEKNNDLRPDQSLNLTEMTLVTLKAAGQIIDHTKQWPDHCQIVCELLTRCPSPTDRAQILAASFQFAPVAWCNRQSRKRLHQIHPGWPADLLAQNDQGFCAWESLLAYGPRINPSDRHHHNLLSWVARHLTPLLGAPQYLEEPHPGYPSLSRAQVLSWLWALSSMSPRRRVHWNFLVRGMDFNYFVQTQRYKIHIGALVLANLNVDEKWFGNRIGSLHPFPRLEFSPFDLTINWDNESLLDDDLCFDRDSVSFDLDDLNDDGDGDINIFTAPEEYGVFSESDERIESAHKNSVKNAASTAAKLIAKDLEQLALYPSISPEPMEENVLISMIEKITSDLALFNSKGCIAEQFTINPSLEDENV